MNLNTITLPWQARPTNFIVIFTQQMFFSPFSQRFLGVFINRPTIFFIDVLTWREQQKALKPVLYQCCEPFINRVLITLQRVQAITILTFVLQHHQHQPCTNLYVVCIGGGMYLAWCIHFSHDWVQVFNQCFFLLIVCNQSGNDPQENVEKVTIIFNQIQL